MKSGISLVEMAQEIQRQNDLKADYMLDTRSLRLEPFGGGLYLNAYDQSGDYAVEPLEVNAIAHRQIGTHLKIPAAYYDKMLEEYPELLAQNVNAWFQRGAGCAYGSHHRRHSAGVSQQPLPAYRQPRYCRDCPSSPSGDGRDAL